MTIGMGGGWNIPPKKETEEKFSFCCPICGSHKFHGVPESGGHIIVGSPAHISHYTCAGCSILFGNPRQFTKK